MMPPAICSLQGLALPACPDNRMPDSQRVKGTFFVPETVSQVSPTRPACRGLRSGVRVQGQVERQAQSARRIMLFHKPHGCL